MWLVLQNDQVRLISPDDRPELKHLLNKYMHHSKFVPVRAAAVVCEHERIKHFNLGRFVVSMFIELSDKSVGYAAAGGLCSSRVWQTALGFRLWRLPVSTSFQMKTHRNTSAFKTRYDVTETLRCWRSCKHTLLLNCFLRSHRTCKYQHASVQLKVPKKDFKYCFMLFDITLTCKDQLCKSTQYDVIATLYTVMFLFVCFLAAGK